MWAARRARTHLCAGPCSCDRGATERRLKSVAAGLEGLPWCGVSMRQPAGAKVVVVSTRAARARQREAPPHRPRRIKPHASRDGRGERGNAAGRGASHPTRQVQIPRASGPYHSPPEKRSLLSTRGRRGVCASVVSRVQTPLRCRVHNAFSTLVRPARGKNRNGRFFFSVQFVAKMSQSGALV